MEPIQIRHAPERILVIRVDLERAPHQPPRFIVVAQVGEQRGVHRDRVGVDRIVAQCARRQCERFAVAAQ